MSRPSFHEWLFVTCDWRVSSGLMKGRRFTFDAFPCQVDIVRDQHRRIVVMKSAQMALSEQFSLARPFYHMDVNGGNWGVLFPTQSAMRDFFRSRIRAVRNTNPYIARHITTMNDSAVTAFGGTMFLRYTTTEAAIATFDADGITVDEYDLHNKDALYGAQASRTQGSMEEPFWHEISTPTYTKSGIHKALLESDHRIWLIFCPRCGHDNDLTRKVGEFDIADVEKFFKEFLSDARFPDSADYFIPCSRCGNKIDPVTPLDPTNKSAGGGRWVARYPDRFDHGYHIQIFQRLYEGGTAAVLRRVRRGLLQADKPEFVRRWWNSTLGMPYVPSEGRLVQGELDNCVNTELSWVRHRDYQNIYVEPDTATMYMGVDVRGGQYHIWGLGRRIGDRHVVPVVGWVERSFMVRDLWERFSQPMLLIDAAPDTNETRALVKAMGRHAGRAKFGGGLNLTFQKSAEKGLWTVDRARIMEATKAMIASRSWVFPPGLLDTSAGIFRDRWGRLQEYTVADHLKAPVMVKRLSKHGNEEYDFPRDAMDGIDPHYYMAACLAHMATQIGAGPGRVIAVGR